MSLSADELLADQLAQFYDDPLGYVMFAFPWDTEKDIQKVRLQSPYKERFGCEWGPDVWACEFLDDLGAEIRKRGFDGINAVPPIRFATASGHGIGKSTIVAWLVKFILDTRPRSVGTVTANTAEQLKTKTWAEVGKWHYLSITKDWFEYSSGRGSMSLVYRDRKIKWRCDAQTCREENSEAFAGQHAASSTSFYIFDEASNIPDKIFEVREGGLTDGEPMVFDFGNPTRNSGMFYENCVGQFEHRYKVRSIDSRTVQITNKRQHAEWIEDYGIDSDFVKVRVLGQFPSAGDMQFIPSEIVKSAQKRLLVHDKNAPLVIGVDVARSLSGDESVIFPRLGNDARTFPARRYRGLDGEQLASKVVDYVNEFAAIGRKVSAIFIDNSGVGTSPYDFLKRWGYNPIGVAFGGAPSNSKTYRFKADEMAGRMRDALRDSLCIPDMNEPNGKDLYRELTQREYGLTQIKGQIQLESKKDMKERGLESPNLWDALALTFAHEVAPVNYQQEMLAASVFAKHDYDPLNTSW